MKTAALLCLDEYIMSERSVAMSLNICHVNLNRYIKKFKLHSETGSSLPSVGYRPHTKVNDIHEKQLVDYIKNSDDMYFGLSPKEVRKLAFEFAVKLQLKIPENWSNNKEAGADWFSEFLKRNSSISIHRPEATSLPRAMNFNKINVKLSWINISQFC